MRGSLALGFGRFLLDVSAMRRKLVSIFPVPNHANTLSAPEPLQEGAGNQRQAKIAIQTRMLQVNDWIGENVVQFKSYEISNKA